MPSSTKNSVRSSSRLIAVVLVLLTALVVQGATSGTAAAAGPISTFTGTLDATDPKLSQVVQISTPNCLGTIVFSVAYEVIPLTVLATGPHIFNLSSTPATSNLAMYLYKDSFDPANPAVNCVAATNTGTTALTLTYSMTVGTQYYVVLIDDTFTQAGGDYTLTVESPPFPEMGVTISSPSGPLGPGDAVPFVVDVTNAGTLDAPNATVVVTLPPQIVPASVTGLAADGPSPTPYSCASNLEGTVLTCTTPTHPIGVTAKLTFSARLVSTGLSNGQQVAVTTVVSNDIFDPTPANNTSTVQVGIGLPEMGVTISSPGGPFEPGDTVPFVVDVTNAGTLSAPNAKVVITLPPQIVPASVTGFQADGPSPTAYSCSSDLEGTVLTCTAPTHPIGVTTRLTFNARLVSTGLSDGQQVAVTTVVSNDIDDPTPANNTSTVQLAIDLQQFNPLTPVRLFDTRPGEPQGVISVTKQQYGGGNILKVKVAGIAGVPATGVAAVSLNVTAAFPVAPGFVTVFPCGTRPLAANLNYVAGQVVPNAVIAPISPTGEVCFFSMVDTHLIADINGWFTAGAGFSALSPVRLFDTRPGEPQGAITVTQQQYGGLNVLKVKVAGVAGVPATGVAAVSLNVTAAIPVAPGFVTVFPCGTPPLAANLNYVAGQVVPNAVITPVSPDGEVCFFSNADTHLIADINGWFATGQGFNALPPLRVFDTRPGEPQGVVSVAKQQYGGGNVLKVKVAGIAGVPATGLAAVSLNVTAAFPVGAGFVTVYPCGERPLAANLNYVAGQVVPNAVIAPVSASGEICLFSMVDTHLIADINGWFPD